MTTEQKTPVLTPEQVQRIWEIGGYAKADFDKALQDMGLIAPEPDCDDVLLDKAERQARTMFQTTDKSYAREVALRFYALKRGMEPAPAASPLTREMAREALRSVDVDFSDVKLRTFHAALTGEKP